MARACPGSLLVSGRAWCPNGPRALLSVKPAPRGGGLSSPWAPPGLRAAGVLDGTSSSLQEPGGTWVVPGSVSQHPGCPLAGLIFLTSRQVRGRCRAGAGAIGARLLLSPGLRRARVGLLTSSVPSVSQAGRRKRPGLGERQRACPSSATPALCISKAMAFQESPASAHLLMPQRPELATGHLSLWGSLDS